MSNEFVKSEISKIITNPDFQYPSNMAYAASWIIANFKGINLKIFDVKESSSLCDFYVIASTTNAVQSRAICDEILVNLKNNGMKNISTEGLSDAEWVLIDFGDIIIHLFQENSRDIYNLDSLWMNMPQLKIPNDYYHSNLDVNSNNNNSDSSGKFF